MAQRILEQSRPATSELDRLIFQMETTLGKPHTVSPFAGLYAKYQVPVSVASPAAEEKKEVPVAAQTKQEKPKKEKQPKKPAGGKGAAAGGLPADLSDELKTFTQCDIRVGKIVECEPHPESDKLYIEKIDLGEPEGKIRTIVSGLQNFVSLEDMLDGKVIVFANMKARKLAGIMSEGMVLCASNADHTAVELMRPHNDSHLGERVTLEGSHFGEAGLPQEHQPILNPKRKVEPKLLEKLTTNGSKEGLFDGICMMTASGKVTAKTLANATIN